MSRWQNLHVLKVHHQQQQRKRGTLKRCPILQCAHSSAPILNSTEVRLAPARLGVSAVFPPSLHPQILEPPLTRPFGHNYHLQNFKRFVWGCLSLIVGSTTITDISAHQASHYFQPPIHSTFLTSLNQWITCLLYFLLVCLSAYTYT